MRPEEEEEESAEYDSGPFCWHWSDPSDCDEECLDPNCKHRCGEHRPECSVEGCPCEGIWYERNGEVVKVKDSL
jgi:hypothetical protein